MGSLDGMRYFIGALVGLGLIILVIVLIFHGGSKTPTPPNKITDYATSSSFVRMTVEGPVSASETHYNAEITVSQDVTTLNIIRGYENDVTASRNYAMSPQAYSVFLHALDKAGYTKGDNNKKLADERGYCPLGKLYIFELRDGDKEVQRYWTSSCNQGTYHGKSSLTITLFEKQAPDYSNLAGGVGL